MSESPITPDSETIATDVTCIKCSYNLRTMQVRGRCPECGTWVIESIDSPPTPSPTLGRWLLGITIFAGLAPCAGLPLARTNNSGLVFGAFLVIAVTVELAVVVICIFLIVLDRKSSALPVGVLVLSALFSLYVAVNNISYVRSDVRALLVGLGFLAASFAVTVLQRRRIAWIVFAALTISALAGTWWALLLSLVIYPPMGA